MVAQDVSSDRSLMQIIVDFILGRLAGVDGGKPTIEALENWVFAELMTIGCLVMGQVFVMADSDDEVVVDGVRWKPKERVMKRFMTRFGEIEVPRWVHQPTRNGHTRAFVEERLGIVAGFMTPSCAKLAVVLSADLSTRDSSSFFKLLGGMVPSRSTIQRLIHRVGGAWEEHRLDIEQLLRDEFEPPKEAVTVAVMLDGVMVDTVDSEREALKEAARSRGQKIGGPVGYKEASGGALSFYDEEGNRLLTRRFSRMPEANKATLKDTLRKELEHVRSLRPDLRVLAISDGAPNNWDFLESLRPDYQIVDFYHTVEHIKRRLDNALGPGTLENQQQLKELRVLLRDTPDGHKAVFARLTEIEKRAGKHRERKESGRGAQPTFYERHAGRMEYAAFKQKNLPIGSGVIEGTVRHIVVDRLRRTGMRWSELGGQAILSLRTAVKNGDFGTAWSHLIKLATLVDVPFFRRVGLI